MLFEQIPFDSRTFVRGYSCAEKERKANLVTLHEALIILDDKRDVSIFVHFGPGLAGSFSALLVVVARGLYLARHPFTLLLLLFLLLFIVDFFCETQYKF